ncbi:GA-like domain-containing protein [Clostridium cibarium]|uniref:GA-like domain-containing protein n=1 Tax=Clostridium cibarium TaxID=2762247 RepID=UPI001A9AB300|nr:fibronectin type III domain-containing protein [Clostridium cibarium]
MSFLLKKSKFKWISNIVPTISLFAIVFGCNLLFSKALKVSALDSISLPNASKVGIKEISAGDYTVTFIKNNGTALGLGNGQALGTGSTEYYKPSKLSVDNIKQISHGRGFSVILKNDGTLYSSGWNATGQLGIGSTTDQSSPVKVSISDVKEINCGAEYALYLKNDGSLWYSGSFGNRKSTTPANTGISGIKKMISGRYNCILVRNDNTLLFVGNADAIGLSKTTSDPTTITNFRYSDLKQISCGYENTLYLKNDGTVWGYGSNNGMGDIFSYNQTTLKQIPISGVKQVSCGKWHTVFLKNDGTVWGVGSNMSGQLGIGNTNSQSQLAKMSIDNVAQVIAGDGYTIFVKNDGTIWFTGETSGLRQLLKSDNTTTPVLISNIFFSLDRATEAVLKAENSKLQSDVNAAKTLLNDLPENSGDDYSNLTNRLYKVQYYIDNLSNATNAVIAAENTKTQANISSAQAAINSLPNGDSNRIALQKRLDAVKTYLTYQAQLLNAKNAVAKAENSKLQTDVTSAQSLVTALQNGADKTALQARLTSVQNYINNVAAATTKVTSAETTKTQASIDLAQSAINLLPVGDNTRTALQNRLNAVQASITYQTQLANATNAVAKAEVTKLQADVTSAQTLVTALIDGAPKTALQTRLTAVQLYIDNVNYATTKVENAENTKVQANVDLAQAAINLLPEGDSNRDTLQSRLDAIQNYIDNLPSATNIKVTQIGKDSISISWQPNSINKLRYQIKVGSQYVALDGTLTTTPTWILLTNKNFTIKGLTTNTSYDISVKARNQEGIICFESGTVTATTLN